MANLANFAYDPINYDHLRTLGVLNLFLEQLCENETTLCRFALGGLCNLALGKFGNSKVKTYHLYLEQVY